MRKPWKLIGLFTVCAVLLVPLGALADDIVPSSFSATLLVGNSASTPKTVNVSAGTPTTVQTDIFFLSDTTGSMGGTINTVRTNANAILTATSALGNVQWAVGEYRDNFDAFVFRLNQAMTANQAAVTAGIGAWVASGGGDFPEANLYAIQQSTLAASGWRTGSARLLVQFGDAPGHDPSGPTNVTEAQATAALVGPPVTKLIAVDVGLKNQTGQETRMVAASGGTYLLNPDQATLVDAVLDAITSSFSTYSNVSLDLSELPAGLTASFPGGILGFFDRSIDRSFDLGDLTFTGDAAGIYDFNIYALVDGARVATESEHIVVGVIPVPSSLLLLGSGLWGLIPLRRKLF